VSSLIRFGGWAFHRREAGIVDPIAFLEPVIPGVHLHHERWDGAGYPHGIAGEKIPLGARIFSIIDTLDAITSKRPMFMDASGTTGLGAAARACGAVPSGAVRGVATAGAAASDLMSVRRDSAVISISLPVCINSKRCVGQSCGGSADGAVHATAAPLKE